MVGETIFMVWLCGIPVWALAVIAACSFIDDFDDVGVLVLLSIAWPFVPVVLWALLWKWIGRKARKKEEAR